MSVFISMTPNTQNFHFPRVTLLLPCTVFILSCIDHFLKLQQGHHMNTFLNQSQNILPAVVPSRKEKKMDLDLWSCQRWIYVLAAGTSR